MAARGRSLAGLSRRLEDLHLEPEEAFGDYDEQLLFLEPRQVFPDELAEGWAPYRDGSFYII